ncbi:MAG: hypothetical protein ABIR30_06155 [Chitinophagaceae bacterium]
MKRIVFCLFILCWTLSSCHKDVSPNDVPPGTISVKIDNDASTFNVQAKATVLTVTGGYGIQIHGYKKEPSSSGTDLTITIARPQPLSTGTYTENANSNPLVTMIHFVDLFFGYGTTTNSFLSTNDPLSVTITELTAVSVKGTFRGELHSGPGAQAERFISGVFNVSF